VTTADSDIPNSKQVPICDPITPISILKINKRKGKRNYLSTNHLPLSFLDRSPKATDAVAVKFTNEGWCLGFYDRFHDGTHWAVFHDGISYFTKDNCFIIKNWESIPTKNQSPQHEFIWRSSAEYCRAIFFKRIRFLQYATSDDPWSGTLIASYHKFNFTIRHSSNRQLSITLTELQGIKLTAVYGPHKHKELFWNSLCIDDDEHIVAGDMNYIKSTTDSSSNCSKISNYDSCWNKLDLVDIFEHTPDNHTFRRKKLYEQTGQGIYSP